MLRNLSLDLIVCAVRKSENCRLKCLVENGRTRIFVHLLFLDGIRRNSHNFTAADEDRACNFAQNGFQERDDTAIECDGQDIAANRDVADVINLLFV